MANVTSNAITVQSQLDKIGEEEDRELWILEDEFYTGCSSDEECETDSKGSINLTRNLESASETPRTERLPQIESATSVSRNSNCSNENEKRKISWQTERELLCGDEGLLENKWEDYVDLFSVDTEEECIEKEIAEMKNLDNIIRTMNIKVKRACEETLFYQRENRKRLEEILGSNPSESGRLAENTQQFFHLCPNYTKLNAESKETSELYVSLEGNESKQDENQNYTSSLSIDTETEDDWEFIDTDDYSETITDPAEDSDPNPYILSGEIKEMLLEVEKSIITVEQNFVNNMERQVQARD